MHSSTFDSDVNGKDGAEVLVGVATLVTEGRIPGKLNSKSKKFFEGPHCTITKRVDDHQCDLNDSLCLKFDNDRDAVLSLWHKNIPLCIEVLLTCMCEENGGSLNLTRDSIDSGFLLEQWHFNINYRRHTEPLYFNLPQLVSAIRSQLYFSQLTAWLTTQDENSIYKISKNNLHYRLSIPGETYETLKFSLTSIKHDFPITDIGNGLTLKVTFLSLPRMSATPTITCPKCASSNNKQTPPEQEDKIEKQQKMDLKNNLVDDRMHTSCTLKGKHRCEDYEELDNVKLDHLYLSSSYKRICHNSKKGLGPEPSTSKPKLMVNIEKANNNQKNEKRNISPNEEQKVKSVKLDYEVPDRLWYKLSPQAGSICRKNDLNKGQLLLDAIERSGQQPQQKPSTNENGSSSIKCESDKMAKCDMSDSDIFSIKQKNNFNIYVDNNYCDSPIPKLKQQQSKKFKDISNNVKPISTTSNLLIQNKVKGARQKLTFGDDDESIEDNNKTKLCDKITTAHQSTTTSINGNSNNNSNNNNNGGKLGKDGVAGVDIPTPMEQAKFRKNLDNAASMVFHSRTGLPLTSSPAPVRRGKSCFDFDSSINSVSAIKSALFSSSFSTDDESESEGSIVSPCSPETYIVPKRDITPVKYRRKGHAANLLGSFEESVLNGRLEPVSTVHGFTAELGASGSFVPKHLVVPVTVFFYTLGDNDKVSSPYLSHINLGKKGYNVPKSGTVQVTLFNPLGTVVKMFVIMYDLSDMPPNSQTFIRQRTLYMPANCKDDNLEWGPKWLRYLIHLRFMSSKSGKIYLHSDIRMIIFRKCDMDTATAHGIDMSYELRSFTHAPTNPRFSPRK